MSHAEPPSRPTPPPAALTYVDPTYGFSFQYPADHTVQAFEGDKGYVVLVTKPNSPDEFQIFLTTYSEPGPITPAMVRELFPNTTPTYVEYPELPGAPLAFATTDSSLGSIYDIWFTADGRLYQRTARDAARGLLLAAIKTWRSAPPSNP